ncbi:MAG: polysaccharide deacetylase family protein [Burkholderiales bacterium]|nr:polysaccharide deacetylase family protein [Burkholderiales bacterium]
MALTEPSIAARAHPALRVWWPTPALGITALAHAGGVIALAHSPHAWPWVAGALVLNHAALAAAAFAPRSRLLGPNLVRLPAAAAARREIALTFDDGPHPEFTPRVLDLLDRVAAKASFFLVGERARRHARLAREIVARGHAVENHSHRHSPCFACGGVARMRREIAAAQAAIADAAGVAPAYFRAPFGIRSPLLEPALAACGLRHVAWTRRGYDTVGRDAAAVLARLTRRLEAGDVLLLHDAPGARAGSPHALAVLPAVLERIAAEGLRPVTLRAACADARSA